MSIHSFILVLLILMVLGSFPVFPYNRGWGYMPVGGVLAVLLVFALLWGYGGF